MDEFLYESDNPEAVKHALQHMLEDPTTGKIDGTFTIPYSNVFGKDEKDFIWYPMIDREGTCQQPVSLDTLYNL